MRFKSFLLAFSLCLPLSLFAQTGPWSVTYDGNGNTGGTVPIDGNTYNKGEKVTVLSNSGGLVKTGFVFSGWNSAANGSGDWYQAGELLYMEMSDVTLYAQWTATLSVIYDGNGSTGGTVPLDSAEYEEGETVTVKTNSGLLVKAGWNFSGWNTSSDGGGTSYAEGAVLTMGTVDLTLYARWTANPTHTVAYDGNGSTSGTPPAAVNYEEGETVTVLANTDLEKIGYTFTGWNTSSDGGGTAYNAGETFLMGSSEVTLYAQWTLIPTYSVTYDGNGSTGGTAPVDPGSYPTGTKVMVLDNSGSLVKSGFAFTGWNTASDGGGTGYVYKDQLVMGSADVTLYAQWAAVPTYSVTYDGNGNTGGTVPVDAATYEEGETVTVETNSGLLVKTGLIFSGWNTSSDGGGTSYAEGAEFTMGSADLTLYARWTANPTHLVSYDGNGHTGGTPPAAVSYEEGETVTVLDNPGMKKSGYAFTGWNTSSDGGGTAYSASDTFIMGSSPVTLYAQWILIPTYTVTYDGNGSTGGTVPVDPGSYPEGEKVMVLDNIGGLVKSGFTFSDWNTASDGSGTAYKYRDMITIGSANVTLYAQWTPVPTYTVTYDGNGSTSGTVPVDAGEYAEGEPVTVADNTGGLVLAGNTFIGWNTASDGNGGSYSAGQTLIMESSNVTLYAQWTTNPTYMVTYAGNGSTGGTVPAGPAQYEEGVKVTIFSNTGNLEKTGHAFSGWNTADDGSGTSYNGGESLTMGTADVTLYAQWTLIPTYTVTYDGNGSTGGAVPIDPGSYLKGQTVTVLGDTGGLVKTDSAFAGWNTSAEGLGISYSADDIFPIGSANVTLYAQWVPAFSVTYDGNGNTGGTVPVDAANYLTGETAVVMNNTGLLEKTGYSFAGWNTEPAGGGTPYDPGENLIIILSHVTLYAQWTANPTYTVTYDGNGSTDGTVPVDGGNYEEGATVTVLDNIGSLVKTGFTFSNWNTAPDGSGSGYDPSVTFTMGNSAATLYAQWTANPAYTVTYDGNGNTDGTVPVDGGSYEEGATVTLLDNSGVLEKTGYTFSGWNTAADGSGNGLDPSATFIMGSSDVTIYAQWTLIPTHTVTYDGNGGTGGSAPVDGGSYAQGETVTVAGNTGSLEKAGHWFSGWNSQADGSGTGYGQDSTFSMGGADVTLFAQWTIMVFDLNVTSSTGGSTQPEGIIPATYDVPVVLTAAPDIGCDFSHWTIISGNPVIGDSSKDSTTAVLTEGGAEAKAVFTLKQFTLTVQADSGSSVLPANDTTVNWGDSTTVEAVPGEGYEFSKWLVVSGIAAIKDTSAENTKVVLLSGDAVIKAVYTKVVKVNPIQSEIPAFFDLTMGTGPAETQILRFGIPELASGSRILVTIQLFDLKGKLISVLHHKRAAPGYHSIVLNDRIGSTGSFYVCRMRAGDFIKTVRFPFLK